MLFYTNLGRISFNWEESLYCMVLLDSITVSQRFELPKLMLTQWHLFVFLSDFVHARLIPRMQEDKGKRGKGQVRPLLSSSQIQPGKFSDIP